LIYQKNFSHEGLLTIDNFGTGSGAYAESKKTKHEQGVKPKIRRSPEDNPMSIMMCNMIIHSFKLDFQKQACQVKMISGQQCLLLCGGWVDYCSFPEDPAFPFSVFLP
jgi:hypothetical protein